MSDISFSACFGRIDSYSTDPPSLRIMSEVVCTKTQEEYEDDFEKDLDWLISEEGRSEDQVPQT